tara:strand:- start:3791 stop:4345 length:555 start_codon:yes stop_codon:yes gene_type:complete
MAKTKRKTEHYVNNKDFLEAMIEFKKNVTEAEESGLPRPRVTPYIGECFLKIANGLSTRPNFSRYTFKDEMIMDGVENCLQYIDNFNPEKYNNPFAYFTQIIWYAFLRKIAKEKRALYTKFKVTERANIFDMTSDQQIHDDGVFDTSYKPSESSIDYITTFIEDFEKNKRRKVKKRKGLEKFME